MQSGNHFIYDVLDFKPFWSSFVLLVVVDLLIFPMVYLLLYWYSRWVRKYFQAYNAESPSTEAPILSNNLAPTDNANMA